MPALNSISISIPGGYLITSPGILNELKLEQVRELWLRTRNEHVIKIVENVSSSHIFPKRSIFNGIKDALINTAYSLSANGVDIFIWEFNVSSGHIRRGTVPRIIQTEECPPLKSNIDFKYNSSVDKSNKHKLRARDLTSINLPRNILVNNVAAYLGRPLNLEIGWLTAAPAVSSTPNWNGTEVRTLTWSGHQDSFARSEVSALLEGIERRVGALESGHRTTVARACDLSGRIITPEDFPPYPEDFYGNIGVHFDPYDKHEWVTMENLYGEQAWMPREYVYYGEQIQHHLWALTTSSGCATGSTITEARLFGLLELIERDSFIGSWYAGIKPIPLDLTSDISLEAHLARAKLLDVNLQCGILPSITGIPVIMSVATHEDEHGTVGSVGAACHPSLTVAIKAAINEAWTYIHERVTFANKYSGNIRKHLSNPCAVNNISDHPLLLIYPSNPIYQHLIPEVSPQLIKVGEWEKYAKGSAEELLGRLIEDLSAQEVDVWFHTQTSSIERQCGLQTVMSVSPQLLPIDFGWSKQRALQSPRLANIIQRHGTSPQLVPHPFS